MSEEMKETAPGVHVPARAQRILYDGDPKGDDYRDAQEWAMDIRSRLVNIRGELRDLGKIEAVFEFDRTCEDVASGLTLAIIALHSLVAGERSFGLRAEHVDALWEDVEVNPDAYVIREGTRPATVAQPEKPWDWHPTGIFERGGRR